MLGQNVGYVRVSSAGQNPERQLAGLKLDRIFEDETSGGNIKRPGLDECRKYLRAGDTLHVHSIDRLARSLRDLEGLIGELTGKGVTVRFHREGLAFSGEDDPMSKMLMQMMGAVAEFERALIRERQAEGIAKAKAKGKYKGRKRALSPEQAQELRERAAAGERVASLARKYRISRACVYNYLKFSFGRIP